MNIDSSTLNSVLYYGYNPACDQSQIVNDIKKSVSNKLTFESSAEATKEAKLAFQKAINAEMESVQDAHSRTHVIPLSSGLDSRAILAFLLECDKVEKNQIKTISFGQPGTWDFKYGQQVATEAGVDNRAVDISSNSFDWSISSIQNCLRYNNSPSRVFVTYVNSVILTELEENSVVWHGFLGGPTAGSHQPEDPCTNWIPACEKFSKFNELSANTCAPSFEPINMLIDNPYIDKKSISYEEQLDFYHRQSCFLRYAALPQTHKKCTPFANTNWLKFSLNLPHCYRRDRQLFKNMLKKNHPDLFSIPTDANDGLTLDASQWLKLKSKAVRGFNKYPRMVLGAGYTHPNTNYLNFDYAFRHNTGLKKTAQTLLHNLSKRDILEWIDENEVWRKHQSGINLSKEIRSLCTLEIYISTQT